MMSNLEPMLTTLKRETLSDQIAGRLRQYITAEALQPGDALPSETKLADLFGVSRPVVREAFRSLAAQGVVSVVSGKGAVVKPVGGELLQMFFERVVTSGHSTFSELMEVRKPLEVQSAALAAARRTAVQAAALETTVTSMRAQLADLAAYAEADVELHLQIAAAAHNEALYLLISSIRTAMKELVLAGLSRRTSQEQLDQVQQFHEEMVAGIIQGDSAGAAQAMSAHFDDALSFVVDGENV
jgi:GntR family transcriptional repressor for pyruvate dehydrogenase complex